jgi:hypothetical protein
MTDHHHYPVTYMDTVLILLSSPHSMLDKSPMQVPTFLCYFWDTTHCSALLKRHLFCPVALWHSMVDVTIMDILLLFLSSDILHYLYFKGIILLIQLWLFYSRTFFSTHGSNATCWQTYDLLIPNQYILAFILTKKLTESKKKIDWLLLMAKRKQQQKKQASKHEVKSSL